MSRPSRDEMLMEVASVIAKRSSCSRMQVGVVVARDGRILSTGYNGAPAGLEHCDHSCDCLQAGEQLHAKYCRSTYACIVSIHAEANALAYAARYGMGLERASLYTTLSPCLPCSQLVVAAGIQRVVYFAGYRDMSGVEYLRNADVDIERLGRS